MTPTTQQEMTLKAISSNYWQWFTVTLCVCPPHAMPNLSTFSPGQTVLIGIILMLRIKYEMRSFMLFDLTLINKEVRKNKLTSRG